MEESHAGAYPAVRPKRRVAIVYGVPLEAGLFGIFVNTQRMTFVAAANPIAVFFGLTQFPGILLLLLDGHAHESLANLIVPTLIVPTMTIVQSLTFAAIIHWLRLGHFGPCHGD